MTIFAAQIVRLKRDILISNSLDLTKEDIELPQETTANLMLEAYSLAFAEEHKTERRLYEIYFALRERFPKFALEVRFPVFFRSKMKTIKTNKFLWSLLSYED